MILYYGCFDAYRKEPAFAAREPNFPFRDNEDEAEYLSTNRLVTSLEEATSNTVQSFFVARDTENETAEGFWINSDTSSNKFLWVVRPDDVKIALEAGELRRTVTGGVIKHTNLTAGMAHSGGELWFDGIERVYINGCSGRFTPRSSLELECVVSSFQAAGYRVCTFGWDSDMNKPVRLLRKADIKWQ